MVKYNYKVKRSNLNNSNDYLQLIGASIIIASVKNKMLADELNKKELPAKLFSSAFNILKDTRLLKPKSKSCKMKFIRQFISLWENNENWRSKTFACVRELQRGCIIFENETVELKVRYFKNILADKNENLQEKPNILMVEVLPSKIFSNNMIDCNEDTMLKTVSEDCVDDGDNNELQLCNEKLNHSFNEVMPISMPSENCLDNDKYHNIIGCTTDKPCIVGDNAKDIHEEVNILKDVILPKQISSEPNQFYSNIDKQNYNEHLKSNDEQWNPTQILNSNKFPSNSTLNKSSTSEKECENDFEYTNHHNSSCENTTNFSENIIKYSEKDNKIAIHENKKRAQSSSDDSDVSNDSDFTPSSNKKPYLSKTMKESFQKISKDWVLSEHKIIIAQDVWFSLMFCNENKKMKTVTYMDEIRRVFVNFFSCLINVESCKISDKCVTINTRKCSHSDCPRKYRFKYIFHCKDNVDNERFISFSIEINGGEISHSKPLTSQLKGKNREHVRNILKNQYAVHFQNKERLICDLKLKDKGNLGDYKALPVYNKVRQEALASQDHDKNDIEDLHKILKKQVDQNQPITIHSLSIDPFFVYFMSHAQLDVLIKLKKKYTHLIGHVDATGTIARCPQSVSGMMMYYAGVINVPNVDEITGTNFTFMEMLTNKHTAFNIKLFLMYFKNYYLTYTTVKWPIMDHVVTDFSKALLNAISLGWNNLTLLDYVNLTYEWLHKRNLDNHTTYVKIHLCYAHLCKNFSNIIKKHFNLKLDTSEMRFKLLNILKLLMHEKKYEQAKTTWKHLSAICSIQNSNEVQIHFIAIDSLIEEQNLNFSENNNYDASFKETEESNIQFDSVDNDKAQYLQSKFYIDFLDSSHNCTTSDDKKSIITNKYYRPNFVKEILTNFMPYYSLFAPVVDLSTSDLFPPHFTNAAIESKFGQTKHDLDNEALVYGKRPVKSGRFFSFSRKAINNNIYEIMHEFPKANFTNKRNKNVTLKSKISKKIVKPKQKTTKKALKLALEVDPVESWKKSKKSSYMQHFSKIPVSTDEPVVYGASDSSSTDIGDDNDKNNIMFSNNLIKNPKYYSQKIFINNTEHDNYLIAIHDQTRILFDSFNSFSGSSWVENEMIDVYLNTVAPAYKHCQIEKFQFGSILFLAKLSNKQIAEMTENFVLKNKVVLFPIFDVNHFYLIIIDCEKKEFIIADNRKYSTTTIKYNKFYTIFSKFSKHYNSKVDDYQNELKFPNILEKIFSPQCNKSDSQTDCGIYLLLHAEQYMKNKQLIVENINIPQKRLDIQKSILKHSANMHCQCLMCGENLNLPGAGSSVRCSICNRWMHDYEIGQIRETINTANKFICPVCNASGLKSKEMLKNKFSI